MIFSIKKVDVFSQQTDVLVAPVFKNESLLSSDLRVLDRLLEGKLSELFDEKTLTGKDNEVVVIHGFGELKAKRLLLVGLGERSALTCEKLRKAAGEIVRRAKGAKAKKVVWLWDIGTLDAADTTQAVAEGAVMGGYTFDCYKTKPEKNEKPTKIKEIVLAVPDSEHISAMESAVITGLVIGESVNIARDLANMPPNDLTPSAFVDLAKKYLDGQKSIMIDVIDKKKAKALGMHAFLGVGQGTVEPCYMMAVSYHPMKNKKPIGLVGKGVTFDTGGISIKPSKGMEEMKGDMSGAAAVLGTVIALSKLKVQTNVLAVMPLSENMPSGSAQRPGDIVAAMNGKTIEITNTDAEGRLILADALCYAVTKGCSQLVDIATLTGACLVALGDQAAAILGSDQGMIDTFLKVGERTGERLWQLPLYEEYFDYIKSDSADMVNSSENRLAGTAVGAIFLKQFVGDTPWVHLDIASMMHYSKVSGYTVKGMSGVGVRTLVGYCRQQSGL